MMTDDDIRRAAQTILRSKQRIEHLTAQLSSRAISNEDFASQSKECEEATIENAMTLAMNAMINLNSIASSLRTIAGATRPSLFPTTSAGPHDPE